MLVQNFLELSREMAAGKSSRQRLILWAKTVTDGCEDGPLSSKDVETIRGYLDPIAADAAVEQMPDVIGAVHALMKGE